MISKLLLATNNKDKVTEIKKLLIKTGIEVLTLKDLNLNIDIEEDKDTLEGNALKKAEEIYKTAGIPCSADDTGLFVNALNGEPGVFSSRYAGENVSYSENRVKLLLNMNRIPYEKRTAYFKTVLCFYNGGNNFYFFEGICKGYITTEERGKKGFGYDAIFQPEGFDRTFAELSIEEKNKISHRAKAFNKFRKYLETPDNK